MVAGCDAPTVPHRCIYVIHRSVTGHRTAAIRRDRGRDGGVGPPRGLTGHETHSRPDVMVSGRTAAGKT